KRLRIEKRGAYFSMWLADEKGEFRLASGSTRIALKEPFYVGIGVCSHDKDVVEKAVFSNVELKATEPVAPASSTLYSTLEIINVASTDRRAIYVAPERFEAPNWMPDGKHLLFNRNGRIGDFDIYAIPATGGEEKQLTTAKGLDDGPEYSPDGNYIYFNSERTGHMQIWRMRADGSEQEQITFGEENDWFPHLSPDGEKMVFLTYDASVKGHPENKDVMLRMMTLKDKKIAVLAKLFGGQGTMNVPSWSLDGKQFAFVSYQLEPKSP